MNLFKIPFLLNDKTFWKFIAVGIVNTLIGTVVMFLAYNLLHCSYWLSSSANYVIGSIVSYFLNKHFTFEVKEHSWKYVWKFVVNIAVCYFIAYGVAKPMTRLVICNTSKAICENIAMLTGMFLFVACNYLGQRFFAFRQEHK